MNNEKGLETIENISAGILTAGLVLATPVLPTGLLCEFTVKFENKYPFTVTLAGFAKFLLVPLSLINGGALIELVDILKNGHFQITDPYDAHLLLPPLLMTLFNSALFSIYQKNEDFTTKRGPCT